MQKSIDVGVFIPTVSRGWFHSVNTRYLPGTYEHVLHVVRGAELWGYDFVLSPQNWRGTKGTSKYWRHSLNSMAVTGALLQATNRIKVWSTGYVTETPPAVFADTLATFDQIAPGRIGLNIVTGGKKDIFDTLGMWDDSLDHAERYEKAAEWVDVVKALWTQDVVNHDGKYFHLYDAMMDPKPSVLPTLVNAGASESGLKFAIENCDIAFIACGDDPELIQAAKDSRRLAESMSDRPTKIYALLTLIPGETSSQARELMEWIEAGVDLDGLADMESGYRANKSFDKLSSSSLSLIGGKDYRSVQRGTIVGSYDELPEMLARVVTEAELDGVMLIVPDYIEHLQSLALRTFPRLAEFGITTRLSSPKINANIRP
ncbi:LLM class flavin-dependent oxidoreductase [Sphingobium fuliginis]|nr:LLM class flavin-dependent oxidoreductase [Sphingobium fuliginis]